MSYIYKSPCGRHCTKEGKEEQCSQDSGALTGCYTPQESVHDIDFKNLKIIHIDYGAELDVDKLKELLQKYPGQISIISKDTHSTVEVVERPLYCKYCFNARVYEPTEEEIMDPFATELTDDNDSSSIVVGEHMRPNRSIMINSGNGKPLNIEFLEWNSTREQWETVGLYHPKYCPECGRKLDEYDEV